MEELMLKMKQMETIYNEKLQNMESLYLEHFEKQAEINSNQDRKLKKLLNKFEKQYEQNSYVSFTATATTTREYNYGDHVLFDSVLRNYGNYYDSETSTFNCSYDAYYLFSIAVRTGSEMRAQVYLDNTPLVSARAQNLDVGTNLVVTYCAEGQSVWVMCNAGEGNSMYDDPNRWSTFSGTLLRLA